jgi:alkylhydroperoxidase family enzyme
LSDDQIASLDGDWSDHPPAEQAAFAFTRRLAYEPHRVTEADLERLRKHYTDVQALEILVSVAGFAAMNRWTETLAIPAEADGSRLMRAGAGSKTEYRTFLRPTSMQYQDKPSKVAPLGPEAKAGLCRPVVAERPGLEGRAEVEAMLDACRKRTPRFPQVEEEQARALLPADWPKEPLPQWVRLLATFPKAGKVRIVSLRAAAEKGKLDARLKAQIAWIAARHDRAWYAVGYAKRRLQGLGLNDDAIYTLDGPWNGYTPAERAVFALARKVTIAPASIEDSDVLELRKHYSDHQVAEVVYHITLAAFFDRVTEVSGLRLEEK